MPNLSATTLKLYQECPRCFWFHVNKKVERPRGPFPSLPSGMDRILKNYFELYRGRGELPPLIAKVVPGRLAHEPLTLGFTDEKLNARLWGKLDDCLILADERLAPLDHKTRASPPDDLSYSQQYYQFQMDVYTLLLERQGRATARKAVLIYYTPEDHETLHEGFPFSVTVHEIPTDPDRAYDVFRAGAKCLAGELPPSAPTCEYCRWMSVRAQLGAPSAVVPNDLFA